MKKTYEAPEILFEDFALSTSISAGCEKIINPTLYNCGVPYPGLGTIFLEESRGCTTPVEDVPHEGFCYHVPSANMNMFNS